MESTIPMPLHKDPEELKKEQVDDYIQDLVSRVYKILPTYEQSVKLYESGASQNPFSGLASYLYKLHIELIGVQHNRFLGVPEVYQVVNTVYGLYQVFNSYNFLDSSNDLATHEHVKSIVFNIIPILKEEISINVITEK